ncbi:MAG: hypothetical protein QM708_08985 [Propioniciclava sp.]|uniref:hypothetical protein n=1 Tax=Propioniciclava sp. TaxID=2038686 RepID=UPI0039E27CDF
MQLVMKVVAVGVVAIVTMLAGCSDAWMRSQIDLLDYTRPDFDGSSLLKARDATAELCGPPPACVQAVRGTYHTLYKFRSIEDARSFAESLVDQAEQYDPLVLVFDREPVSPGDRAALEEMISTTYVSSPD